MNKESLISNLKIIFYPLIILWKFLSLRKEIIFPHDGNTTILVPSVNILSFFSKQKISFIENNFAISRRIHSEALLRTLVFELIQQGTISKDKHIIDIGCWIGDNALIWSKLIENGTGKIYAIDPSPLNIHYVKTLAKINSIENILLMNEVCSNKDGIEIFYNGNINHCDFNTLGHGKKYYKNTNTLDSLIAKDAWDKISLIHLDVEGLEEDVLIGSKNIVSQSKPIIIFEHHISDLHPKKLFSHIESLNYELYMINEVLPESRLDTRNFIAIQSDINISSINKIKIKNIQGCWPAVVGPPLIKVNLDF